MANLRTSDPVPKKDSQDTPPKAVAAEKKAPQKQETLARAAKPAAAAVAMDKTSGHWQVCVKVSLEELQLLFRDFEPVGAMQR